MKSKIKNLLQLLIPVLILVTFSGCATTGLVSVWMNDKLAGTSYNDLLVIGISEHEHNRRLFEEHFTDQLKATGVESEVSYTLLPDGSAINAETVNAAIKGKNIDAVIVTHVVGVEKETVYVQSIDYISTRGYYHGKVKTQRL